VKSLLLICERNFAASPLAWSVKCNFATSISTAFCRNNCHQLQSKSKQKTNFCF
jgi:hypothetical protein